MTDLPPSEFSVCLVGAPSKERDQLLQNLKEAGASSLRVERSVTANDPDIVFLTGATALEHLQSKQELKASRCHYSIAVVSAGQDPSVFIQAGADDIVEEGIAVVALRTRLALADAALRQKRSLEEVTRLQRALLTMRQAIAERGDGREVLREILCLAAGHLHYERASFMAHVESGNSAFVLAATDDPTLSQFEVSIEDYPEVREAIATEKPVLVSDVRKAPVTETVANTLQSHGVLALAVFPVIWKGRSMGVLLFRKATVGADMSEHGRTFGTLLGSQLASQLRDSTLFDRLREQTRRFSRAGYEAERRAKVITSLSDYFESSTEGVLVVDQEGEIVYANGSASSLTGFANDSLLGTPITSFIPSHQSDMLADLADSVFDGRTTHNVDMEVKTTSGAYITVSVTTSTVLSSHGAMILSLRDVSEQRLLQSQLHHSNEFMTNLIDSAVDAIIAVDMRGTVILFNTGAEQLFGYSSEEVVDTLQVSELYPPTVPQQVMSMLRSEGYGGVGRLEQIRREVVVRDGEQVPVNMTASIIYENGKEVATVGIFSDLRDRIRIEQHLMRAQEQLKDQEQRSLLAKLAGAAAHELNQPLTSIMGYAQLILRTSEEEAGHLRHTGIIVEEAERMAEIVKKIGRITHYETVPYVGNASIVDLDRSVEASESAPVPVLLFDDDEPTGRISLRQIAESHEEEMRKENTAKIVSSVPQSTDKSD